jgi:hypothetical protein
LPRKIRRQRVILRPKQREAVQRRMRVLVMAGVLAAGSIGILKVLSQENGWAGGFVRRHTPLMEMRAPNTLAELALLKEVRPSGFRLWLPGSGWVYERRWLKKYPALSGVRLEKRFFDNRLIAHLEPRVPLVRWEGLGVDKDGNAFALASEVWPPMPKAVMASKDALPAVGRWAAELSRQKDLWPKVVAISQDLRGEMWLNMDTGAQVAWGSPDIETTPVKARFLARVLEDAHERLSGAATADMRFFDEGRVIVRPKSLDVIPRSR